MPDILTYVQADISMTLVGRCPGTGWMAHCHAIRGPVTCRSSYVNTCGGVGGGGGGGVGVEGGGLTVKRRDRKCPYLPASDSKISPHGAQRKQLVVAACGMAAFYPGGG
ncbi:hypothetical protein OIU84_005945 [Salix udensis]|uniref:Uncharacterized protein n=1 Tax=Salix udensis TaxID=889485 RepID=A0AAD6JZK6_9ROSI|nr:hypothetical protein OIU84_005945 [Salix udensis]